MANTVQIKSISPYQAAVCRSGMGFGPKNFDIMACKRDSGCACLGVTLRIFSNLGCFPEGDDDDDVRWRRASDLLDSRPPNNDVEDADLPNSVVAFGTHIDIIRFAVIDMMERFHMKQQIMIVCQGLISFTCCIIRYFCMEVAWRRSMVQIKVYYRTSGDVLWYRLKCTIERLETFYGTD